MVTPSDIPSCWVISDGRRGIENQALGLAEAMAAERALEIQTYILSPGRLFGLMPPKLQMAVKRRPTSYGLNPPYPQIAIGCGRQAIAALCGLKKHRGDQIFTIYVQDPRMDSKYFDVVVAPNHDRVLGDNVISILGSPNRVTQWRLKSALDEFKPELDTLPPPRVCVLIGGHSKTHRLTREIHRAHTQLICGLAEQRYSVMLTTSRRTPKWAVRDYRLMSQDRRQVWVWDGQGKNPYFAFLAAADAILVTEDSTNMLVEACATGKPIFSLAMDGKPGKFQTLYDELESRCHVTPFLGATENKPYEPLNETRRAATLVWQKFAQKYKTAN